MVKALNFLVFFISFAVFTQAAQAGEQRLTYDVYAGGIHAVEATLDLSTSDKNRYSAVLNAHTRGFLATLAPWEGIFETRGWRRGQDLQPEIHRSVSIWRGEEEVKEYRYNRDGTFKSLVIHHEGKKPKAQDVAAEITDHTMDVLTATVLVMEDVNNKMACEGESYVFDGKRRFNLVFQSTGAEQLKPIKYNVFDGVAARCIVEVVPAGGAWHKKPRGWMSIQEQGREKGTMPTVWMAQVEPGGPVVPIKIFVKTDYGALFMQLSRYEGQDDIHLAQVRE